MHGAQLLLVLNYSSTHCLIISALTCISKNSVFCWSVRGQILSRHNAPISCLMNDRALLIFDWMWYLIKKKSSEFIDEGLLPGFGYQMACAKLASNKGLLYECSNFFPWWNRMIFCCFLVQFWHYLLHYVWTRVCHVIWCWWYHAVCSSGHWQAVAPHQCSAESDCTVTPNDSTNKYGC